MHADSVVVNVTGKFPEKYYKKKVTCEITPVLKSASGTEVALKTIKVQGEKVQDNNSVINMLAGGGFSYTDKVAYTQDMRICDVNVKIHAVVKKKFVDFEPVNIGKGTIATPGLLEKDSKAIMIPQNYYTLHIVKKYCNKLKLLFAGFYAIIISVNYGLMVLNQRNIITFSPLYKP